MQEEFAVTSTDRLELLDVTDELEVAVPEDVESGTCHAFVQHTTAGLLVNEAEPRLVEDLEAFFADLVPDEGHRHDQLDGNADSHLRASLVGPDLTVPIRDGALALGTWQSVLLAEFDGPRERTLVVTVRE